MVLMVLNMVRSPHHPITKSQIKMNRKQLVSHLKHGEAFQALENFLDKIPFEKLGVRTSVLPYSVFELFHHIVFTQKDILDFILSNNYRNPEWPKDYWPKNQAPKSKKEWDDLVEKYYRDRGELINYVLDENNELDKLLKNGTNQTLLREILLVIEHTSYHTGQIVVTLRLLKLI